MQARFLFAAATFAATLAAQLPDAAAPPPRHLVLVRTTGPAQLQQLLALDLDLAACQLPLPAQRRVEVIVDDKELAVLQARGFQVTVLQRDLSAWYAAQAARFPNAGPDAVNPPLGQGAMGGHWTLAQLVSILDDFAAQYPAICSQKVSIGNSIENRPLWMVKISDNVGIDENEPEVLYDALHHAREPLSMEATIVFMDWLLSNYGVDPEATLIVDERELFFVPCVNPDGYEYNRQTNPGGGGLWRKNRRLNGDGSYGVDLNRNYATGWTAPNGGSSTTPSSETYRGTAAFSEPETAVLEAFSASRQFVNVFSTHTYTDVLLRPWAYQNGDPANVAAYNTLGSYYVQENGIQHGSCSALLYIASGGAVDHHHVARGSYSWTAELGRSNEGGFWPSGQAILDIATRHQPMFRKVALTAGPAFAIDAVVVAEGPGGNGNGTVQAGENGTVAVTVRNFGIAAATGGVALQSLTAGVTVGNGTVSLGSVPAFGTAGTGAVLTFAVAAGLPAPAAQLEVSVTGDGRTVRRTVTIDLIARRLVLRDDFEQDRGSRRAPAGTATTGLWERSTPQATASGSTPIQPGTQTTPGGSRCWVTDGRAGTSAGTYDVDNGYTDFETPVLDLQHLLAAEVRLQYWYAESVGDDPMTVSISRDGGTNWSPAFTRSNSTGAWTALVVDLGAPLTDRMRLRVRAQDLAASLVECLVDDLEVHGVLADGSMTLLGSGGGGTQVQVAMHAAQSDLCFPLASFGTAPGLTYPGVGGSLLVDPATAMVLPFAVAGSNGRAATEVALPGGFAGLVFHFQTAVFGAGGASFGPNRTALTLQ
ncbi:MAG: hypothetical protein FJ265_07030 [Planctomycetes bacterium]|nr:hypothetical protein [Planctomycetota bacterium]